MHTPVVVDNRREAKALQRALADPTVKTFVLIYGELLALPSPRARQRVLAYIIDKARDLEGEMDAPQLRLHLPPTKVEASGE